MKVDVQNQRRSFNFSLRLLRPLWRLDFKQLVLKALFFKGTTSTRAFRNAVQSKLLAALGFDVHSVATGTLDADSWRPIWKLLAQLQCPVTGAWIVHRDIAEAVAKLDGIDTTRQDFQERCGLTPYQFWRHLDVHPIDFAALDAGACVCSPSRCKVP